MAADAAAQAKLTAEQYRDRARLIRRHAEGLVNRPTVRQQLLELAEQYEQLAESSEQGAN